jgi:adenosylcobinamide-phosphate synthase
MLWVELQAHQGLLIFTLAIVCSHLFPLQDSYHPSTLLNIIFKNILLRTHKQSHRKNYQILSGFFAFVTPILLIVVLCYCFSLIALYPQWLGGGVLYLCLDTRTTKRAQRICLLLAQEQKSTARQLLARTLVRETANLSPVGIAKACIDSTSLNTFRHFYVVLFLYLLFGPLVMLTYKLMLLADRAWRQVLQPDAAYMQVLQKGIYLFELLPLRSHIFLLALTLKRQKVAHYIKHYANYFYQKNSGWVLSLFAANLEVQLCGPCIYHSKRYEKMRLGLGKQPLATDIEGMLNLLSRIKVFTFLLIALIWLIVIFSKILVR